MVWRPVAVWLGLCALFGAAYVTGSVGIPGPWRILESRPFPATYQAYDGDQLARLEFRADHTGTAANLPWPAYDGACPGLTRLSGEFTWSQDLLGRYWLHMHGRTGRWNFDPEIGGYHMLEIFLDPCPADDDYVHFTLGHR